MKVSVVIPCRNEEKHIAFCVQSLFENGFDQSQMEVLVIDGMSTDSTPALLNDLTTKYPHLRVFQNPEKVTPHALNIGIKQAIGSYTMIASAHSSFDKGYIQALFDAFQHLPDAIAVGGNMKTEVKNSTQSSLAIQRVLSSKFGVGNAMFRVGTDKILSVDTVPFGLYKSVVLKESGGYNERLIRNHDIELSKRLLRNGGSIYLIPSATCTYYARERYTEMATNNFRNGKWNLLTVWITKNFSSLSIRHFIPMLFVMALFLPLILTLCNLSFVFISLTCLVSYVLALVYFSSKLDKTGTTIWHLIAGYFILHLAYGFGSLTGLFIIPTYIRK
jgi:cellulose synthase/poly-beta-1,6-N-acetylglucosamine synthase-like glycosyltransferase